MFAFSPIDSHTTDIGWIAIPLGLIQHERVKMIRALALITASFCLPLSASATRCVNIFEA